MMKYFYILLILALFPFLSNAQPEYISGRLKTPPLLNGQTVSNFMQLKNGAVYDQKLDSVRIVLNDTIVEKNAYTYDSKGNISEDIWSVRTPKSGLAFYRKYNYTFDNQNNLTYLANWRMNDSLTAWVNPDRKEFIYNAGLLVTEKAWSWWFSSSGKSERMEKREFAYDTNGKMTREDYFTFEGKDLQGTDIFKYVYRTDYTYNSKGLQASAIQYDLGDTAKKTSKIVVEYTEAGNPALWQSYYWNTASNQWVLSQKQVFEYNGNGHLIKITDSFWNGTLSTFVTSREQTLVNNTQGKLTEYKDAVRSFTTGKLEDMYLRRYTYASDGDVTDYQYFTRDADSAKWDLKERYDFVYDKNTNITQIANFWDFSEPVFTIINEENYLYSELGSVQCFHKLLKADIKKYNNDKLAASGEMQFFYSPIILSQIPGFEQAAFQVYPNPADTKIRIDWNAQPDNLTLRIYSQLGVLVRNEEISNHSLIPVDDLKSGLYIIRLTDQNNLHYQGKLLIN